MRRRARERAVQFLFGLEFTKYAWDTAIEDFWAINPVRLGVKEYAEKLIEGVIANQDELDKRIDEAIEHWSPERVGRIERNVLRVAAFELLHCPDVPRGVAISEAIEVAKRFGSDEAPRFINGVLDRLGNERAASPEEA
jgi:N utilization substance protein B